MAKFTDVELKLFNSIKDDRLVTSLGKIREAIEDIWSPDAPRIIQDYTDHGVNHCIRLFGFADRLLEANGGLPLTSQEAYLLIAGIYLHDIGMQCDVLEFPVIMERARELGAKFDKEFSGKTASQYTIEEQKLIRKNHQYLSIAWIDSAFHTDISVLGPAIKTVPEELVGDLMDVCKHHAKLPITDCPVGFQFDPNQRKQFIAALLRFSDELDIDGHRVSIESVKNFSLDPRNSLYWWLHNRTKIVFTSKNVILITIRLHPDDVRKFGSHVHAAFITEFQTKNQRVLTVLAQNGIPININADSKVISHEHTEPLPRDIVLALQIMEKRIDPLISLADEVRTWLRAIRYEVSDPQQLDNRKADMIAALDQGSLKQRVLVRCIDGEIIPSDIADLDSVLDRKTPQGWLISDKRVLDQARERVAHDDAIRIFNLSDFLRQMVWSPYIDFIKSLAEKDHIPDLYVDLACYRVEIIRKRKEINKYGFESLDGYMDSWLKERGKVHISLLGDFGAGKTWFCRHYAYRQMERYLQDPANERIPLLITLRAFIKALTPQQLINDAMLEQYKLPFVGSAFEVFQEMNRRGKLLLILDGFDEMARQVDYQTVVDNFWELANLVDENSKVILTSRTEYFRWAEESQKILAGEEYGRRTIVLRPPKFEVLYIEPFSDQQIQEVIVRRLGAEVGSQVARRILAIENLAEMARKPVLVELLLAALDEVNTNVLDNPAQVYLYATNKLLLRNIDTQRTFTSTSEKVYFLCELAWEMIISGELRIHYSTIPERIKTYFGDRIKDQHELDTWDFDLRAQTLLHRDAAGYYEFAHKSLAEYFTAYKIAASLGWLASEFMSTYREADGHPSILPYADNEIVNLREGLSDFSPKEDRFEAILKLLPGMSNQSALRESLEDFRDSSRLIALEILGRLEGEEVEQILLSILNDADENIRLGAAWRLRDSNDPRVWKVIESLPPVTKIMTTYFLGDDLFDESFSIDAEDSEFLGEFGIGISETIGFGEPKKVTAFEVWLFDKKDIRTGTIVFLSKYAFGENSLRVKLEAKGVLELAQPKTITYLSTRDLTMAVQFTDLRYLKDALLPMSAFESFQVELKIWRFARTNPRLAPIMNNPLSEETPSKKIGISKWVNTLFGSTKKDAPENDI